MNDNINLCDNCQYCIADCDERNPIYGNGVGNDNVIKCKTYESQWVDVKPLFRSLLGKEYKEK